MSLFNEVKEGMGKANNLDMKGNRGALRRAVLVP
jgi:hypothetical protein